MAVRSIKAALVSDLICDIVKKLSVNAVQVIHQHGTTRHLICLSAVIFQVSGNETTLVLNVITLFFR